MRASGQVLGYTMEKDVLVLWETVEAGRRWRRGRESGDLVDHSTIVTIQMWKHKGNNKVGN